MEEGWLILLVALLCPLSMGLMMLFMPRGMRKRHGRGPEDEAGV